MSSYTVYLDSEFNPVAKEEATLIKRVDDNGKAIFYRPKPSAATNPSTGAQDANTQKASDVHAWYAVAEETTAPMGPGALQALCAALIAKWQAILLLGEWEITFSVKDVPRVEQGITVSFSEKKATIELSSHLTAKTAEEDIAHEMLHILLYNENWRYDEHCDEMLRRDAIDQDEYTALQEGFNLAQNITIEHTKRILKSAGVW